MKSWSVKIYKQILLDPPRLRRVVKPQACDQLGGEGPVATENGVGLANEAMISHLYAQNCAFQSNLSTCIYMHIPTSCSRVHQSTNHAYPHLLQQGSPDYQPCISPPLAAGLTSLPTMHIPTSCSRVHQSTNHAYPHLLQQGSPVY